MKNINRKLGWNNQGSMTPVFAYAVMAELCLAVCGYEIYQV